MGSAPGPRGPYQNGIRRRREIVDAASRIFARYGYVGGSLRQIAAEVGVTPAALARHFDNKQGLLEAVLEHWEQDTTRQMDGARGLEYFRRLPLLSAQHASEPGMVELLLTLATEATNPQHPARDWAVARYSRTIEVGTAYLREARQLGEIAPLSDAQIDLAVRAVFALMDGLQLQWLLDQSFDLGRALAQQLEAMIVRWSEPDAGLPTGQPEWAAASL